MALLTCLLRFDRLRTLHAPLLILALMVAFSQFTAVAAEPPRVIRVVTDDNYPPYVFKDDQGKLKGIIIDQWRLWEKKTGIRAEVTGMDWADAQRCMLAGEFDVIDTIFRNEHREKLYDFTKPYARLDVPLFFHSDISGIRGVADLKGFLVGAKSGDAAVDYLKGHGISNIAEYPSYEKLMEAARDGKVKIFSVDRPPALYYLNKMGIQNRFRETSPLYSGEFHRAVAKGNLPLLQTVEAGFNAITPAEYREIDKSWLGTPLNGTPYFRYAGYVAGAISIILCGLLLWLRTLKRAVTVKTSELASSEERYRSLIDNIPLGITLIDRNYRIIMVNKTQATMFGQSQESFAGRLCHNEFEKRDSPCGHCPGTIAMTTGNVEQVNTEGVSSNGKKFSVSIRAVPIVGSDGAPEGFIEVVEDITEKKQAEEERQKLERQLLHAQKLESLGVLAGGIAHDFNNILTAIVGNAELAVMRLNPESPARENLRRIETAAGRAADLARQMLAYSGKGAFLIEPIDLNRLIEEMGHMLEVSISKKAILRYELAPPLPSLDADATQLRQIVMNLVINASEAIGDKSGVISIRTGIQECTESYLKGCWLTDPLPEGVYVFLEVSDNGCGMDRETQARIFDPFFTTKFTGRGLGMAAVLGIIRGHGGTIKVYSEPGKGTSFKVLLPSGDHTEPLPADAPPYESWRGTGIALLVDDEDTVRTIGSEMLQELGFEVTTAADGREALEKFKSNPEISLVILDLTMPHMDGEQCFRELRLLNPNVMVIISSGFSEGEVTQKFVGKGLAGFIQKPYKMATLKELLQNIQSAPRKETV